MDETKEDRGDLFGALVKRKVYPRSSLYTSVDLFNLSLPSLEFPPEIFCKAHQKKCDQLESVPYDAENLESKLRAIAAGIFPDQRLPENLSTTNEEVGNEQNDDEKVRKYFSLTSKHTFSVSLRSNVSLVKETTLILGTIFALKGVSTAIINLESLSPNINVLGRTGLSTNNFLFKARYLFVLRSLIDCACSAYCNLSTDAGTTALGAQITLLLHIIDASLNQLSDSFLNKTIQAEAISNEENCRDCQKPSLVTLWDSTQLHRTLIVHLYSLIRPTDLLNIAVPSYSAFLWDREGECNYAIQRYLCPATWAQLPGGWSLLHQLMRQLQSVRATAWTAATTMPIFQTQFFLDNCDWRVGSPHSGAVASDFACMILTGVLTRQVAAPLLLEVTHKLYQLDADFYQAGRITQAELADSLQISVEALWGSFQEAEEGEREGGGEGEVISAESCVEFLLCALVWSRGRIDLMLTEPSATASTSAGASDPNRRLSHHDHVSLPQEPAGAPPVARGIGREELIRAFRDIAPTLVLPMNGQDEVFLADLRRRTEALQDRLRDCLDTQVHRWYQSFATLSDYYNEHAVTAKSLFAKAERRYRSKRDVLANEEALVSFRQKTAEEDIAKQRASREQTNPAAAKAGDASGDVVIAVGPLSTPKSVPMELIEKAKDQIRAKYDTLIKEVEGRGAAAAWENRRLQSLSQARTELAQLFEQDDAELQKLRALKEKDTERYMKHFEVSATETAASLEAGLPVPSTVEAAERQENKDNAVHATAMSDKSATANFALASATLSDVAEDPAETDEKVESVGDTLSLLVVSETSEDAPPAVEIQSSHVRVGGENEKIADGQSTAVEIIPTGQHTSPVEPADIIVATTEGTEESTADAPPPMPAGPSHRLQDLAAPLLQPETGYFDAEEQVYAALQSLSSAVLLLGEAHGLVSEDTSHTGADPEDSQSKGEGREADSSTTLHSVHSVFMRSLGRAVLAQCRAINLASAQCLINHPVDLLGHIRVVDNLLLVSPNSDFLMSLCTSMVDNHLQQIRTLRRQKSIDVLSSHLSKRRNACMWNDESLQLGFTSVLTSAGAAASEWKAYGTQFAALNIDTVLPSLDMLTSISRDAPTASVAPSFSINEHIASWERGLFSAEGLDRLYACYDAPWPVPTIISRLVLNKFTPITQRFLELGHLVALFRVVWGEQRYSRVLLSGATRVKKLARTSKSAATTGEKVPALVDELVLEQRRRKRLVGRQRTDRQVSDAMRLVQQTVQSLFDYLSERVYVHQAQFKQAMRRVSSSGLDGVVYALNTYADALDSSALQLSDEEAAAVQLNESDSQPGGGGGGSVGGEDPVLQLKVAVKGMLDSCRGVLRASMAINEATTFLDEQEEGREEEASISKSSVVSDLFLQLEQDAARIKERRAKLVAAALLSCKFAQHHVDLESLIMRFQE